MVIFLLESSYCSSYCRDPSAVEELYLMPQFEDVAKISIVQGYLDIYFDAQKPYALSRKSFASSSLTISHPSPSNAMQPVCLCKYGCIP